VPKKSHLSDFALAAAKYGQEASIWTALFLGSMLRKVVGSRRIPSGRLGRFALGFGKPPSRSGPYDFFTANDLSSSRLIRAPAIPLKALPFECSATRPPAGA
jgi:hypothetical protein